jgi:hypothetical protein
MSGAQANPTANNAITPSSRYAEYGSPAVLASSGTVFEVESNPVGILFVGVTPPLCGGTWFGFTGRSQDPLHI